MYCNVLETAVTTHFQAPHSQALFPPAPLPRALDGQQVRLEPLEHRHGPALAEAAAGSPELYRWTWVPYGPADAADYVRLAVAQRDAGTAVPFAVIRAADGMVVGSTRYWQPDWWAWPTGHRFHGRTTPDTCEIGHTWLAGSAVRTGANTEMKLLMLGYAFETWAVHCVTFHTDARNERSREALGRIGARFEGILRAHRMAADHTPRDSARYSIVASEWPAVREQLTGLLAQRAGAWPSGGRAGS
jgi:RimJ/RimL family protein N-acetyltransferase